MRDLSKEEKKIAEYYADEEKNVKQIKEERPVSETALDKAIEKHFPEQKAREDYENRSEVFRRKLHKGKFAPVGYLFLVMHVYGHKQNAYLSKLIPGNLGAEMENFIANEMRAHIYLKFKL